ncbi:hypothetical protein L1F30_10465 [Simiduia sp. 21SJ11W-1]|uniref:hypothetical protein n=1 Tax=Simiduia sp. 21SJ11W-1 TaxID=2909669 RepID=UPI00209FAC34|nr:hypothetical protein [Simiduia sp. 21SJ11W-1]UTA46587.1 hypothetical protein L1F30_10465 [Simiduia sp. 21SJ11W-1]
MDALKSYRAKFEALSQRERALVLGVALVVIYGLWSLLIGSSQTAKFVSLETQVQQLENDLQSQTVQIRNLENKQSQDPDAEMRRQLAQARLDLKQVDDQLANLSVGLIAAADLPRVLENVLLKTDSLRLVSLQTLPIEQLKLNDESVDANADLVTGVFKHRVKITLAGSYFKVADYLVALEALDWRFFWSEMRYVVEGYPSAKVELEVYTLTTERGNFGA